MERKKTRHVPLEVARLPDVDHLGHDQGRGLSHGAGCADGVDGAEDGLEKDGRRVGDWGVWAYRAHWGRLVGRRRHDDFLLPMASASPDASPDAEPSWWCIWGGLVGVRRNRNAAGSQMSRRSRSNSGRDDTCGTSLGGDVNVGADDSKLLVFGLPDHVHFHFNERVSDR